MKKLIPVLLLLFVIDFAKSEEPVPKIVFQVQDRPQIKIDPLDLQHIWVDKKTKQGSCVHACLVTLFRYQDRDDWAVYWRANYRGGMWNSTLVKYLEENEIPYRNTFREKDVAFLERAMSERIGTLATTSVPDDDGFASPANHMLLLVHLDNCEAAIIDTRISNAVVWMDREEFLETWFYSDSWATTVLLKNPRKK